MYDTCVAMIARYNDQFRQTLDASLGRVVLSSIVANLEDADRENVLQSVRQFNEFNQDNDPYGEHDMGFFLYCGERYLFKIDYYDRQVRFASEDPSDIGKTVRVLTIMQMSEY